MQILKEEIRQNILEQATLLFFMHGYSGTSTRMIAEKTGMHYSSMYRYFKNKTDLFEAVVGPFYWKFKHGYTHFLDATDDRAPVEDRISKLEQGLLRAVQGDRRKFVILLRRSKGTQYESVFSELVALLKSHLLDDLPVGDNTAIVMDVIARNFFKGVGDIAEQCTDPSQFRENLSAFIRYHLSGMDSFT